MKASESAIFLWESDPGQPLTAAELTFIKAHVLKYDKTQPRHPKGTPIGGQWRDRDSPLKAAADKVLAHGKKTNTEMVVITAEDGSTKFEKAGDEKSVNFTQRELEVFRNNIEEGWTVTHNHPTAASLSYPDFGMTTFPGIKEVIAVGELEGKRVTYTGSVKHNILEDGTRELYYHYLRSAYRDVHEGIFPPLNDKVEWGILTPDEVMVIHQHVSNLALAEKGLINYKVDDPKGLIPFMEAKANPPGTPEHKRVTVENLLPIAKDALKKDYLHYFKTTAAQEYDLWNFLRARKAGGEMGYAMVDVPEFAYLPDAELARWGEILKALPESFTKREAEADLKREYQRRERKITKYSKTQPRHPKGHPLGGQWVDAGRDLFEVLDDPESVEEIASALAKEATKVFPGNDLAEALYITDKYVIEWNGEDLYPSYSEKDSWIWQADPEYYYPDTDLRFNEDFWYSPPTLYHNTPDLNIDSIDREGLGVRNETRGMSNRSLGAAVFTTTNPEEYALGEYGDHQYAIDTEAMRRDGLTPYVEQEPAIVDAELRGSLAHLIGLEDFSPDIESGVSYDTVIVRGHIPPKYLKRLTYKQAILKHAQEQSRKYDKNQPRYPKGHPLGGQWRGEGGNLPVDFASRKARAEQLGFDTSRTLYHGSKQEILEFEAKYEDGLIFLTTNPEFAASWIRGTGGLRTRTTSQSGEDYAMQERRDLDARWNDKLSEYPDTEEGKEKWYDAYTKERRKLIPAGDVDSSVYPVWTRVQNTFDPRTQWEEIEPVFEQINRDRPGQGWDQLLAEGRHKEGNWLLYERKDVIDYLKSKGYDSIWLKESAMANEPHETLAVFYPEMIRSVNATFDPDEWDKRNILKFDKTQPRHPKGSPLGRQWRSGEGGLTGKDRELADLITTASYQGTGQVELWSVEFDGEVLSDAVVRRAKEEGFVTKEFYGDRYDRVKEVIENGEYRDATSEDQARFEASASGKLAKLFVENQERFKDTFLVEEYSKDPTNEQDMGVARAFQHLDRPQRSALMLYASQAYIPINFKLRDVPIPKEVAGAKGLLEQAGWTHDQVVETMDSAFEKQVLTNNLTLYRGTRDRIPTEPGSLIQDRAFLSTTTQPWTADEFADRTPNRAGTVLKINVPKGSKAINVEGMRLSIFGGNPDDGEGEWLLPRNSQLRVVRVSPEKSERGLPILEVEYLPPTTRKTQIHYLSDDGKLLWQKPGAVTPEPELSTILKYSKTQPRHPKGSPLGGQWKDSDGILNSSSKEMEAAKTKVLTMGANTGKEYLIMMNQDGSVHSEKLGGQHSVAFSKTQLDAMNNPENSLTLVHNHPLSVSLSAEDIGATTFPGAESIVAVIRDGKETVSFRGKAALKITEAASRQDFNFDLIQAKNRAYDFMRPHMTKALRTTMKGWEAHLLGTHFMNEVAAKAGLIEYKVSDPNGYLKRKLKQWAKESGASWDQLVETATRKFKEHRIMTRQEHLYKSLNKSSDLKYTMMDEMIPELLTPEQLESYKLEIDSMPDSKVRHLLREQVITHHLSIDLGKAFVRKYDKTQPRHPKGSSLGGRWAKVRSALSSFFDTGEGKTPDYQFGEDGQDHVNGHMLALREKRIRKQIAFVGEQDSYEPAQRNIARIVGTASITIAMNSEDTLKDILDEGRFKSLHEVGFDLPAVEQHRMEAENAMFGGREDHPIYGYLTDGSFRGSPDTDVYGSIRVELQWGVRERTTFTGGDSLGHPRSLAYLPSMMTNAKLASVYAENDILLDDQNHAPIKERLDRWKNANTLSDLVGSAIGGYYEAQVHGGVTAKDIRKVRYSHTQPLSKAMQDRLRDLGIEVEEYRDLKRAFDKKFKW